MRLQVRDAEGADEDLRLLRPGVDEEQVCRELLAGDATELVILTRGPLGATAFTEGATVPVDAPPTEVVDSVGAGDSFMAGLVSGLLSAGLLGDPAARERLAGATLGDVRPAVERALACAGITVAHAGAYAPTLDEL